MNMPRTIKTALAIPTDNWHLWLDAILDAIKARGGLDGIAADTGLFTNHEFREALAEREINCIHADNLIPGDATAAFYTAANKHALDSLFKSLLHTMQTASEIANTDCFSLNLRTDRIPEEQFSAFKSKIIPCLSRLLSAPLGRDFTIMLPVNCPKPFPSSREKERTFIICTAVNAAPRERWEPNLYTMNAGTPSLAILAHVFPEDGASPALFPDDADITPLREIRFHYDVAAGDTLFDDEQTQWAARLDEAGFTGNVVFHPSNCPQSRITEICDDVAAWANMYSTAITLEQQQEPR